MKTYNHTAGMVTTLHCFVKKKTQLLKMHFNEIEDTDGVEEENKFKTFIKEGGQC